MKKGFFSLPIVVVLALTVAIGTAWAANGYTLFGDAEYVSPGDGGSGRAVQIRSDASPGFGGIDYDVPAGTTFANLDILSTDFMPELDDLCLGGSPRFQIGIDMDGDGDRDGNIFVYFGIDSASPPCVPGAWQNTTDLLNTGKLLDTSQLPGGTFYDLYDAALAKYGTRAVTGIQVVVDASWAHPDGEQTFLIDNTNVDGTLYTYDQPASSDECKDGGWMNLADDEGTAFKNQGDCVSYTKTGS
jgi:hypothetical protein